MEYTPIHQNYIKILNSTIDSKIIAIYSDDLVKNFYLDFANNFKLYESKNSETVEILYGFIDFQKFKNQMLEFKTGGVDYKPSQVKKVNYS